MPGTFAEKIEKLVPILRNALVNQAGTTAKITGYAFVTIKGEIDIRELADIVLRFLEKDSA